MAKLRFIHAADLHIESPYRGISRMNAELGKTLIRLGFRAFDKLIQTCISEEVDFLLIAGDSFDSSNVSLSAQYRFIRGLQQLEEKGIPVYIVCGNHDPLSAWIKAINLPKNVHVFPGNEVTQEVVTKGNETLAHIFGVSFENREENRSLAEHFSVADPSIFSIGLLHGTFAGMEHKNPYCPMSMEQLQRSGMHYWALGHIHKREVVHASKPMVIYPGNLQGRHFNETGEKGVYLVEVDAKNNPTASFVSLSEVVFLRETIVLDEQDNLTATMDKIEQLKLDLLEKYPAVMLRLTLEGNAPIHNELKDANEVHGLLETLNEHLNYHGAFVYVSQIENKTLPLIDWEERKKGDDFIADLLKRYDHLQADSTARETLTQEIIDEINSSNTYRKLRKYQLEESIALNEIVEAAKISSITQLLSSKNDH